jgi:hypothetical protein
VKLYVVAMEALRKKETEDETKCTTKIDGFLSFHLRGGGVWIFFPNMVGSLKWRGEMGVWIFFSTW